jgi:F-box protein 18 (helicase)
MELTAEQKDIIQSEGNIKINAVAGSGKTTTVIAYAASRSRHDRILYLAFNKTVKTEAAAKFAEKGLDHVRVETAHSLAYRHIVPKNHYTVRGQGFKTHEIAEILGLVGDGEKHAEYIVANHIHKFMALFCNSDKKKVQELNYLDVVTDEKAKVFVRRHYAYIEMQTRILLGKMDKGQIDVTHDFYLKKFQLSNPRLGYDYILFDEGQDASPAMLDIFLQQKAVKVIVGDTHQQIYGWRYAVNSLEKVDYLTYNLSSSFRFGQDIANLAVEILNWKNHLEISDIVPISGKGKSGRSKTRAILARTNLGLLLRAIEYVTETRHVKHIYFEGNINSYTYADDGASLYDILNLENGKHHQIRDKLIGSMSGMKDLEEYIEKTEDMQLGMMVDIVKEYGDEIYDIMKTLKEKHVGNEDRHKAEMIFSTVHRSKGMEYDEVHIVNDFISEETLIKLARDPDDIEVSKLSEEINLLYVAVTRAKHLLHIPETFRPLEFPESAHIIWTDMPKKEKEVLKSGYEKTVTGKTGKAVKKPVSRQKTKQEHQKDSYQPWTEELDNELAIMYGDSVSISVMAEYFGRTKGAVYARIKKLQLETF